MDEDELMRFYQKGGDGEVDSNWIAGLYKSEVWELAEYLGVPREVIEVEPTPDLWGTGNLHNDEEELSALAGVPMTYTRPNKSLGSIEWISRENEKHGVINGEYKDEPKEMLKLELDYTDKEIEIILAVRKIEKNTRHKSLMPPQLERAVLKARGCVK
jgi:NH3-dependent NAD+ synthetase